jgi:hypothetical protein
MNGVLDANDVTSRHRGALQGFEVCQLREGLVLRLISP